MGAAVFGGVTGAMAMDGWWMVDRDVVEWARSLRGDSIWLPGDKEVSAAKKNETP